MRLALGLAALAPGHRMSRHAGDAATDPGGGDRTVSGGPSPDGPVPDDARTPTGHPALGLLPARRPRWPAGRSRRSWTPDAPELCLGPVAESWPPQCTGSRSWAGTGPARRAASTSRGERALGTVRRPRHLRRQAMTVTGAVGEAGHDPDVLESPDRRTSARGRATWALAAR